MSETLINADNLIEQVSATHDDLDLPDNLRIGHPANSLFGRDEAPAVAEVKGRKNGAGFATLERWLAGYDALFLRRNNADPLVLLPWCVWSKIMERLRQ